MTALLAFLFGHTSIAIAALGAVATVFAAAWGNLRGARRERDKQAVAEAGARHIKDRVQNDIGALPADAARKELGQWDPARH